MKSNSLLVVAAESSSCAYACRVIQALKEDQISFWGVGNPEMQSLGFECLEFSKNMAVMGLFEILKKRKHIQSAYSVIVERIKKKPPQAALLLDYGGFNLKLARVLKSQGIPVIYYIPPKVWAWKESRALKIKKYVDRTLVVFPFEVDYYKKHNINVEFVGHPIVEDLKAFQHSEFDREHFKRRLGLNTSFVLGLMPGSRESEVSRHLTVMLDAAEILWKKKPFLNICVLVAPDFEIDEMKGMLKKRYEMPLTFVKEESWSMIDICDSIIAASGTATLQVGLLKKPQVVIYKMNPISMLLFREIIKMTGNIKYASLVNIVLGQKCVCPELIQREASVKNIVTKILPLLSSKSPEVLQMKEDYQKLEEHFFHSMASEKVADVIREFL